MPKRPRASSRWLTAATWPMGITPTSWDYMWRTTPMRRREGPGSIGNPVPELLHYPPDLTSEEVQGQDQGAGPLFHRRYKTRIRGSKLDAEGLMEKLQANLNQAAPTKFARFARVQGDGERLCVGDEYVVRMPGPWDGPVRV